MAPIISGLDLIWRNNIDIIALTTDELEDKDKSDLRNEPNFYWNGLIPETIILSPGFTPSILLKEAYRS